MALIRFLFVTVFSIVLIMPVHVQCWRVFVPVAYAVFKELGQLLNEFRFVNGNGDFTPGVHAGCGKGDAADDRSSLVDNNQPSVRNHSVNVTSAENPDT